ncbi:MAG: PocR ligand-binding domain-containing protein [bacterium]|nr:PocR ligand-binding domain-containing protein [bacterium]
MSNIRLIDLLDVESLQTVQDAFYRMTGIACILTDEKGIPVTQGSGTTSFCRDLTRSVAAGEKLCLEQERVGAKGMMRTGKVEIFTCHAGMCVFAAPIFVEERYIGSFIGGQVFTEKPDEETVRAHAIELGIDPQAYVDALGAVKILPKEEVERAAKFLNRLANVMSQMALNNYKMLAKSQELENISRMKTEFLTTVNHNLSKPLQEMLFLAQSINRYELPDEVSEKLRKLEKMNQTVINALADAMEYSEMTRTDSDIVETNYDLLKMCEGIELMYQGRLMNKPVSFELIVDEDVPTDLFGDVTRVRQILVNLLNNSVQYTNEGTISLHISRKRTTYGLIVNFEIKDTGIGMQPEQVQQIQTLFDSVNDKHVIEEDMLAFGLGMTSQLVSAVYGSTKITSKPGEGTTIIVTIPQMEA